MATRQFSVHNKIKVRQINAARSNICRNTNAGTTVAHGLQRVCPLVLGQLTRQRHNRKTTVRQACRDAVHHRAGVAENNRVWRLIVAKHVDNGVLTIARRYSHCMIFNVSVLRCFSFGRDPHRIFLVAFRKVRDGLWHSGREQQRLPLIRRFAQDKFKIFPKAQIKHFISFIQNNRACLAEIDRTTHNMIAQTARRCHDNMCTTVKRTTLVAHVHPTNARRHHCTGWAIEPRQFALYLHRKFASWCNDQRQRGACPLKTITIAQKRWRNRKPEADRFARSCLR